jgi:hypothetical protein
MDTTPIKNDKVVGYNFGLPAAPNSSYGNGIDLCGSTKLKLIDKDLKSGSTLIDTTKISKAVQEAQIKANEALVKELLLMQVIFHQCQMITLNN